MLALAVSLLICDAFAAWGTISSTGEHYECGALSASGVDDNNLLQKKDKCLATGWCFWSGFSCYYDNCLKSLTDAAWDTAGNTLTACGNTGSLAGNGAGSACSVFYLTGVPACSASQTDSITDIYCRESNAAFEHKIIDLCFYNDLKWRSGDGSTAYAAASAPYKYDGACVGNGTGSPGSYTYKDESRTDCSLLTESPEELCKCLGKDHCNLHPNCTLDSSGNNCIRDPCNQYSAGNTASQNSTCSTAPTHCKVGNVWKYSGANAVQSGTICVTDGTGAAGAKSNLDYNECFFAYIGESNKAAAPYDIYPECSTPAPKDACASGVTNDNTGGRSDPEVYCTLESLQSGWFPLNNYCYDGSSKRSLPTPGSASALSIPSVIAVGFAAIVALLMQ